LRESSTCIFFGASVTTAGLFFFVIGRLLTRLDGGWAGVKGVGRLIVNLIQPRAAEKPTRDFYLNFSLK